MACIFYMDPFQIIHVRLVVCILSLTVLLSASSNDLYILYSHASQTDEDVFSHDFQIFSKIAASGAARKEAGRCREAQH